MDGIPTRAQRDRVARAGQVTEGKGRRGHWPAGAEGTMTRSGLSILVTKGSSFSKFWELKQGLADKFPNDRGAYTAGKQEFVHFILIRAMDSSTDSSGN